MYRWGLRVVRYITGTQGKYMISPYGQILRVSYPGSRGRMTKERWLNGWDKNGYLWVDLCLGKIDNKLSRPIHILVAEHYLPNPNNLPEVNHKDGGKKNNWSSNLEWCTHAQNIQHAWDNGLIPMGNRIFGCKGAPIAI